MLVASSWLVALVSLQSSGGSRAGGVLSAASFDERRSVGLMLAGSTEQADRRFVLFMSCLGKLL